jgi:hypothetical protein
VTLDELFMRSTWPGHHREGLLRFLLCEWDEKREQMTMSDFMEMEQLIKELDVDVMIVRNT